MVDRQVGGKIYVDCVLDAQQNRNTASFNLENGRNPTIGVADGRHFLPFPEFFNGAIDDVRVYARALSAADIAALYDLPGGCP